MQVFKTRLRRVGNSIGVLVPKDALDEIQAKEGDDVDVAIVRPAEERRRRLHDAIGSIPGLAPFKRERRDRF